MKVFLSSTISGLVPEREAILKALAARQQAVLAMEYFLAESSTPLDTALKHLRNSDIVLLVIGFKAGSLVRNNPDMTYTRAEYDEAVVMQAAGLLRAKGVSLLEPEVRAAARKAGPYVEHGFQVYAEAWRESQLARSRSR